MRVRNAGKPVTASPKTIFALATPPGRSALAVFRVSGPGAGAALDSLAQPRPAPRTAALRRLRHPHTRDLLDDALVLWFPAPRSETGEDVVELQVHGGRAVIAAVAAALLALPGLRLAEAGEFARRAFENGKIDLTGAEGLADLVDAETEGQRRQALRQSAGELGRLYEAWRAELIQAQALAESAIDFSDEADVGAGALMSARAVVERLLPALQHHLDDGRRGEILRSGFRVVIAGPPNAGKSSLLNALSRRDVAIVSPEAGTTRDVIEVALDIGGLPVIVSDTAGIRATAAPIEQEGIRRAVARARDADLVLWLIDAAGGNACSEAPPGEIAAADVLRVLSKIDLLPASQRPAGWPAAISTATGAGVAELIEIIGQRAKARVEVALEAPAITQARHRAHLEAAALALQAFLAGAPDAVELRAEDLRRASAALGRITGRIDVEEVLDQVFSRFCIGK